MRGKWGAGHQFDSETALYNYRARYYDPTSGRFLSEDPMQFAAGVNFYTYAGNRPVLSKDPFGLWDTYTHSALYWLALKACGLDDKAVYEIQKDSALLDATTQAPWDAYIHSMKAPWQSPTDALAERDNWINANLQAAAQLYAHPNNGGTSNIDWESLFANAIHSITDSTSPAHMQNGIPISWPSYPNAFQHGDESGSIETWRNMTPSLLQQNIHNIQKAWERVSGKKCGCSQ